MPARGAALGLWALVLLQLGIPASYYLGGGNQDDERFAWRMFSDVRFRKCELQVFERDLTGARGLPLEQALHASWAGLLRRGRPAVIEAFLHSRCERGGLVEVTLRRSCREIAAGSFRQTYRMECATRGFTSAEHGP